MKLFLALILLLSTTKGPGKYSEIFAEDYVQAETFIKNNGTHFETVAKRFGNESRFLKSIVFPELIRYSYFSDIIETGVLEWLYVEGGSKSADFSVGHCQMKPSFVERLEEYVSSEESLQQEYGFLVLQGSGSLIRRQRVERLKSLSWQLIYLSCFVEIAQHKFASEVFSSEEEKLRFFCVVYNSGIHLSSKEIHSKLHEKWFPYGPKYSFPQYSYGDVAVEFYKGLNL